MRRAGHALGLTLLLLLPLLASAEPSADPAREARLWGHEVFVYQMDQDDRIDGVVQRFTRDATPRNHHGALASVAFLEGRHGGGLGFIGASSVEVPDAATSNHLEGTLMMWVNLSSYQAAHLFLKVDPGVRGELILEVNSTGHVAFRTSTDYSPTLHSASVVPLGQWTHVAVTWGLAGKQIYLDGELDAEDEDPTGVGQASWVSMLGTDPNQVTRGMQGRMDEVRFYGVPLSASVIASLKDHPYGEDEARLGDSDDDGLADEEEDKVHRTDAFVVDTDRDGLSDGQEVAVYRTLPRDKDTDGDGLLDGEEVLAVGTDPLRWDTDLDGAPDGADAVPTRESIPPFFPDGSAFLVFHEDGYIDLVLRDTGTRVEAPTATVPPPYVGPWLSEITVYPPTAEASPPTTEEPGLRAVLLSGNLTAHTAAGAAPHPLYFHLEAQRGDEGLWGARFALPPGVTRVTQEEIRILAVDDAGNAWAHVQTFQHELEAPTWTEDLNATGDARGWTALMEQARPAQAPVEPEATLLHAGTGNSTPAPRAWAYALEAPSLAATWQMPTGNSVAVWEGGFAATEASSVPSTPGRHPRIHLAGFAEHWTPYVHQGLQHGKNGLVWGYHQTGSVILGSDSAWANGHVAGDFVSGFFVWGDLRDCVLKPALGNVDDEVDAAIVGISCGGLAIDLAQASPGAPGAVAANAVTSGVKQALKVAKRVSPEFAVDLAEMSRICYKEQRLCANVLEVAQHVTKDPAAAARLALVTRAMDVETFLAIAAKNPSILGRVDALAGDYAKQHGDDATAALFGRLSVASRLGTAEATLEGFTRMHKAWTDNPATRAHAVKLADDSSRFLQVPGADRWVSRATQQAGGRADPGESWRGILNEAELHRIDHDAGRLEAIEVVADGGTSADTGTVIDAIRRIGGDLRWTELKQGHLRISNIEQFKKHLADFHRHRIARGVDTTMDYKIGGTVGEKFKQAADAEIAKYPGLSYRVIDRNDQPITQTVPEA